MAQVIPNLGPLAGIGQGLSQGLQTLAERKLSQLDAAEKRSALQDALKQTGRYSDADVNILSRLPEKDLYNALTTYNPSGINNDRQGLKVLDNQPQLEQQSGPNQFLNIAKLTPADLILQAKNSGFNLTPEQEQKITNKLQSLQSNPELMKQIQSQMQSEYPISSEQEIGPKPLFKKPLTEGEKIAQKKLEIAQRRENREIDQQNSKESEEFAKRVRLEHEGSRETKRKIGRMKELIDKGNFGSPLRNQAINWFKAPLGPHGPSFDVTTWMTADAQEMEKLSNDFAKGAKEFFPGRVTDADLKQYMRTVPSLFQSKAGMLRLINSFDNVTEAQDLKYQAYREILRRNGGKRPSDLEEQVEDLIGPQLDKLAQDFIQGPLIPDKGFGAGVFKY